MQQMVSLRNIHGQPVQNLDREYILRDCKQYISCLDGYIFEIEEPDWLRVEPCRRHGTDPLSSSREGTVWTSNVFGKPYSKSWRSHHAGRVPPPNVRT